MTRSKAAIQTLVHGTHRPNAVGSDRPNRPKESTLNGGETVKKDPFQGVSSPREETCNSCLAAMADARSSSAVERMPDAPGHVGVVADGRDEKDADEVHVSHAFQPRSDMHLRAPDSQGLPRGRSSNATRQPYGEAKNPFENPMVDFEFSSSIPSYCYLDTRLRSRLPCNLFTRQAPCLIYHFRLF